MTETPLKHHYNALGAALCEALGLKGVTKCVLTLEVGSLPQVEATMFVEDADGALASVVKSFQLNPTPILESAGAAPEPRPAD